MADFNLSAEVSMDVDPLKASKTTIERNLKAINKSLRDQRKEMKQNEVSAESLAKQETDLGRAIKLQEGLMAQRNKELQDQQKEMAKSNEVTDEQKIKLQNLNAAYEKSKKQLNGYQDELNSVQVKQKTFGKTTDDVKKNLNELRNEVKKSQIEFEKSSKATSDYERHIDSLTGSLNKSEKQLGQLDDNLKIISDLKGENSREAKELRGEISKEQLAFKQLELQLSKTQVEFNKFQEENSESAIAARKLEERLEGLGDESYQVKNSLGQLRDQTKLMELRFKQSSKTVSGYENHIKNLSYTMTKQSGHINLLKSNLKELENSQQGGSRAADKLRNDIIKEALAFQVLQGRIDEATDELKEFKRANNLWGTLKSRVVAANEQINRIGDNFRNFGYVATGVIRGALISNFTTLVPIMGSVISLGAGIGGMLTAAAGGAIGMGGAFAIAGGAVQAFAGQATYALKMLEDGQLRVTKEVSAYQTALRGLKTSWEGLIAQNQAAIFNTMTNGINTAKYALTTLNPFLTKTASQIETASGKMLNWAKTSSVAKRSFDILNTQGPKIFQHLLNATQSFVNGSAALFNKLSPLYSWAARGFADMAKSFDNWANSVQGSKAINGFVEYTKVNLPIVGSIFGNIFSGIVGLFQAFSGHSHDVLVGIQGVTESFRNWATELQNTQGFKDFLSYIQRNGPVVWQLIKNIGTGIWGLLKGMAPVGEVVLGVTTAITGFISGLMNAHPWLGAIVGILGTFIGVGLAVVPIITILGNAIGGLSSILSVASLAVKGVGMAISFLGGPITITIAAVSAFVGVIVWLWNTNSTFRNNLIALWNGIKSAALTLWTGIKLAIQNPMALLKAVLGGIWNNIKTVALAVWNVIKFGVVNIVSSFITIIRNKFTVFKSFLSAIWTGIKTVALIVWNSLKTGVVNIVKALIIGIRFYINTVRTVVSTVFNAVKSIAIRIWTSVKNTVVNLAKGLWLGVKNTFTWLKNSVVGIFNSIKNFAIKVWTILKNTVISRAKSLWTGVKNIFTWLKNSVVSIFNAVKNFAVKIWTSIKNTVISRAKALWNGVKSAWNALKTGTIKIMAAVAVWLIKKWLSIKNSVVNRVKALWTGVKNTWNALKSGTIKIISAVSTWLSKKWTAIKKSVVNKAKALWSGVKGAWNNLKKGTTNTFKAVGGFMSSKWNSIKSGTVNKAKALWSGVKGAWGSLSKGTRKTMNSVGGFMSNKWRGIKNSTVNLVTGMKNKITGVMNKMGDAIKSVTGKIKGFFSGMIGKVKSGLNKLIGGVNWVGEKLGMDKLPKIKLHTGTEHTNTTTNIVKNGKIARDTFATVGDKGKGNGPNGFRHEAIRYPNGKMALTPNKDTTAYLPKGSSVMNGAQTHAMLSANNPTFSKGTLPRFASGTTGWDLLGGGGSKPKKHKKDDNLFGDMVSGAKDGTKALQGKVVKGGKAVVNKTLETAAKGKKWLGDKVGDVMDWIEKPGKLLKKVLEGFGVSMKGFGIPKAASLPYDMMKGMFGKLKKAATDLFTSWMEEQGGDGGYIDLSKGINFGFYKTAAQALAAGYPFASAHHGIDVNYKTGDKLYSTVSGTATAKHDNSGFGKHMWIKSGIMDVIYGHMSKFAFTGSKKVKPGTYLGESGNTGRSSGPHLHYEMRKNGVAFDPRNWLKKNNGGGGKSGKWKSKVKQAAKATGVKLSGSKLNDILKLIQTESGGRAGVTQQIRDVNSGGNEAQGLLQYTPTTFRGYAAKGKKNIKNGYHQLMAFFNNSNWSSDLAAWKRRMARGSTGWGPTGSRRGYATGTNNARRGFNQVFEKGGEIMQMRGGETVIPNDVSIQAFKQIATSDIFSRTQSAVYDAISQYADQLREKQQMATREQMELQRINRENADIKEQNSILRESLDTMKAILGELTNVRTSNEQIRDKEYFPSSREMTKMNNENMALNAATQLMR